MKKEILIKYGDQGKDYFILSKGSVRVILYEPGTKPDDPDLDKKKTLEILDKVLAGETPKPGSYRGRINNEPENNRKTLMDLKNA